MFELFRVALRGFMKHLILSSDLRGAFVVELFLCLEKGLYLGQGMHLIVGKSSLHSPTTCIVLRLRQEGLLPLSRHKLIKFFIN